MAGTVSEQLPETTSTPQTTLADLEQAIQFRETIINSELSGTGITVKDICQRNFIDNLFVEQSQYANSRDPNNSSIGQGLYTDKRVMAKVYLLYKGKIIYLNEEEYLGLCALYGGKPEYLLYMGGSKDGRARYLDCYEEAINGRCLASKVNSVHNLKPMDRRVPEAVKNCRIMVDARTQTVKLEVCREIDPKRELLTTYGSGFRVDPDDERSPEQVKPERQSDRLKRKRKL